MLVIVSLCGCGTTDETLSESAFTSAIKIGGADTNSHAHTQADEPQIVSDPISGYCGNTCTTIYFSYIKATPLCMKNP